MKPLPKPLLVIFLTAMFSICISGNTHASTSVASTIQGTVYDKARNALSDVDVELLDDYYRTLQRQKTDSTGRYSFYGLSDGRFTVKAYAFRYDLMDQEIPVEIITMTVRGTEGSTTIQQDFYLVPKKGGLKEAELGVVFAQDVPPEALEAYDQAVRDLAAKRPDEGFKGLQKAIKLFPTYYNALYKYGMELYLRKQYLESASAFLEASNVNPKSATSLYYVGNALFKLDSKYHKAARTATKAALELAPGSVQVLVLLGKIEREFGDYTDAETHLIQAKKLSASKVPEVLKELAQLYANDMKKYGDAATELELYLKASKISGDDEKKTRKLIADLRAKAKPTS